MKVLYILDNEFPYSYGGIETYLFNLIKNLKIQFSVCSTVFSLKSSGKSLFFHVDSIADIKNLGLQLNTKKSDYLPLKLGKSTLRLLIFVMSCAWKARKNDIDVIHAVGTHGSWIAGLLLRIIFKKPLIVTFHGNTSQGQKIHFQGEYKNNLLSNLIYIITCRFEKILRRFSTVISLHPLSQITDVIIPQGINVTDFHIAPDNKTELIFAGRLTSVKGIPVLLDAIISLKDLPMHLTIVGGGFEKSYITDFISKNNIEAKVTLYGTTNNIAQVLSNGGIFVLPSFFEGFPISLLEAMVSGLPSIATKVGAIPYFFKNGEDCILIKPNSSFELAQAIRRLYTDDNLRTLLSLNARQKVLKNFSWAVISKKTYRLYCGIIS